MNNLKKLTICYALALIAVPVVFAQDAVPDANPAMNASNAINILIGIAISYVIHWLKRIEFVNNNPKKAAGALSAIGSLLAVFLGAKAGIGIWPILISFVLQLATAIGTFETVIKTTTPTPPVEQPSAEEEQSPVLADEAIETERTTNPLTPPRE